MPPDENRMAYINYIVVAKETIIQWLDQILLLPSNTTLPAFSEEI